MTVDRFLHQIVTEPITGNAILVLVLVMKEEIKAKMVIGN